MLEKLEFKVRSHFQETGDKVLLLGETRGKLGGSAYWTYVRDYVGGEQPAVDLDAEVRLTKFLVEAARRKLLRSAHDCSTGGAAVAIAEAALGGPYALSGFGASVDLSQVGKWASGLVGSDSDDVRALFAEDGARAVVSCAPGSEAALVSLAKEMGVPVAVVGSVGPAKGDLVITRGSSRYSWPVESLRETYYSAIPRRMAHVVEDR